jgi:phage-related protein
MNGISSIISSVLNGISGVWSSIWNGISSAFGSIWSGIKGAASAGVQGVVDTVTGIKDKIVGFFSGAGQWLADAGKNIISGLWNGISGAVSGLYDNIKGALTGLVDKAKSALGIHSPSTVFRDQVGVMIGRGTAVGIDRSRPFVSRSLNELADSLTLDGHEFGMDGMMPMVYGKSVTGRQSGYQQGSDQSLLDELRALHTDMPAIMEGMSIQLDGRVVGRVVRQYANV